MGAANESKLNTNPETFWHSKEEINARGFYVTFKKRVMIDRIAIGTRLDCCFDRYAGVSLYVDGVKVAQKSNGFRAVVIKFRTQ